MASIEDRWHRKDRSRTPRYGQGLRYRVVWDEGGRRAKSFPTKDAAANFLLEVNARSNPGVFVAPARSLLVGEYAARWEAQQIHQRPTSRDQIERRMRLTVLPSLGHKRIDQVTRADVQAAVISWSDGLSPSTVRLAYTYLAGMMKAAVLDGVIRSSPCVGVRLPRAEVERVRPLSTEMVQAIADVIWVPYRPMVVFAAATGLRGGELRGLTWDRLNLVRGAVTVDRQLVSRGDGAPVWGPPKTESSVRTISVGPTTAEMLQGLERRGVFVFQNTGRPFTRNNVSEAWRQVREQFPDIGDGWHQLRHYHASQLIAGGMSPVAVAHRLGHKDANETLATYSHLWHDDDSRAASITDGLISLPTPEEHPAAM